MKDTYIEVIDNWLNTEESEDGLAIYHSFKTLEKDLKENHADTKEYWHVEGRMITDYEGYISISYVDINNTGKLFATVLDLETT